MNQSTDPLDIISDATFNIMKEIITGGKKLNSAIIKEMLSEKKEITNLIRNYSNSEKWKDKYEGTENDFESLLKEHERVTQQKNHLLKKLERFDDIDSSSDAFYRRILILFSDIIKSSDNRELDLQIREFKSLLKNSADKQLIEKAFNNLKNTIITETEDEVESLKKKKLSKGLGILGKWVKNEHQENDNGVEHAIKLSQMFQDLIDEFKLIFSDVYLERLLSIEQVMHKTTSLDEFNLIGRSLVDLFQEYIANVNSDREQTSLFIREITKKLIDIDSVISESFSGFKDSENSHEMFHQFLENNIAELENSVNIGKTIEELRNTFVPRLSGINEAIRQQKMELITRKRESEKKFNKVAGFLAKMKKSMDIANKKAKILEQELHIDPLTGAANRRAYEKRMKEEMDRFLRYKTRFSALLLDIDHFKKINDTYGHAIGDVCLKEIIKRVSKLLRSSDLIARYGGEEFVIFMPETDEKGAVDAAERFRKAVEKIEFIHRDDKVTITVSIGATEVNESDKSFKEVFSRMDKALYEAKDNGRNRVVFRK